MCLPKPFSDKRPAIWCAAILLFALAVATDARAEDAKKVLVLHAHHQGWSWTDRMTEGIQSAFAPFDSDIALYFEYLDIQRSTSEADFEQLAAFYAFKLRHILFDVVIVSGAGALRFVRRHGHRIAPQAPVVFCGVSPLPPVDLPEEGTETGVFARMDHRATLGLMFDLHPDLRRMVVVVDRHAVGAEAVTAFEELLIPLMQRVTVDIWYDPVWEELPARLVALAQGDLVYLLTHHYDRYAPEALAAEAARMVERWSPVPAYSSHEFFLGKGIVGGMITSGFHQGEQAGHMALRILSGESVRDIPITTQSPNHFMFDGRVLARFQLNPAQLPPDSIVLHPEPGLWQRHAFVFQGVAAGMVVLAMLFFAIAIYQKRKHRLLEEMNATLDGRVREKSAQLQLVHLRLKKQTLIDGLTGLPNRRYVYQRFSEEAKKAQRYNHPLSIILFDIDWLKQVNLEHGYAMGDMVLRDVGHAIKRGVREIDLVGRHAGEEFLVILPNTDIDHCRLTAQRIQKNVAGMKWQLGQVQVTVSAALAQLEAHAPADLIKLVNDRLADTKSQGHNRIVMASGLLG